MEEGLRVRVQGLLHRPVLLVEPEQPPQGLARHQRRRIQVRKSSKILLLSEIVFVFFSEFGNLKFKIS